MGHGEGTFRRVHDGLLYVAEVAVLVEPGVGALSVHCSGEGWKGQGHIEDSPAVGYDDWKAGAVAGVRYALSLTGRSDVDVTITRIAGIATDTNPTIVGAAAARATWSALAFAPPPAEWARIEAIVFASWTRPNDEVPRFT